MSDNSTESAAPEHVVTDDSAPDEFDHAMDEFASGQTPPADQAAGGNAVDPNETGDHGDAPLGSDQEAGVSSTVAGAAPPAGDQSTDIWANAPAELRQAYQDLARDSQYRLNAVKGRLSAADRELDRLRREQQSRQPEPQLQGKNEPTPEGDRNDPFNPDKLAQLREDYGEVAGPLVDMIEALKGNVDQLRKPVEQIGQERQIAESDAQAQLLASKHPDWQQVTNDDRFLGWYEAQPTFVKAALERNANTIVDGQEASFVLDLFKRDIGIGAQPQPVPAQQETGSTAGRLSDRRQRQLDAARDAASNGGQPAAAGVPDDFDAAMDAYAAKADSARRR